MKRLPEHWRQAAIAAARSAGEAILALRQASPERHRKADGSWVSSADQAASLTIGRLLAALDDAVPVISEEGRHDPGGASLFWLVDPLDGTREFLRGSDRFSVNIALIDEGYPCFGLVYLPTENILYQGGSGGLGAWRDQTAIHGSRSTNSPCRILVSPGQVDSLRAEFAPQLTEHGIQARVEAEVGAIKFCQLAQGDADIYPRRTRTCGWDSAAGQAVLEAAGGAVYDRHWRRFRYVYQPDWYNEDFIAVANPAWRRHLLASP